jgi:NAD+ kinase
MLLPGHQKLRIRVPLTARSTAWASFDGRHRIELKRGDQVVVTASRYPVPTLCKVDPSRDWFKGLREVLRWNERQSQKAVKSMPSNGLFRRQRRPA